jgi:hypothetical protein
MKLPVDKRTLSSISISGKGCKDSFHNLSLCSEMVSMTTQSLYMCSEIKTIVYTLKSLESENGKMSSSFIHVDMDEKLVQDKDSIENINTECKTNVENDVSHNIGTVNIPKTNVDLASSC